MQWQVREREIRARAGLPHTAVAPILSLNAVNKHHQHHLSSTRRHKETLTCVCMSHLKGILGPIGFSL